MKDILITELDLDLVKQYLRIDHNEDDVLLTTMLYSAKSFIQSYLNKRFEEFETIPDEFTIACLAILAHWYERREIQGDKDTRGELKYVFSGLLDLHRNWN
ncbi:head-tail connector protein [Halalkalibacter krulwichiae]|uniref:Phage gp6-like head-tail connector protein n=1 Tax=Halalkalibacter krulwichiae TaxID=199441 RepID=A0A1X9M6J5_9BACI|nr:head-tail connector protein [Halalkalibacter krulwichiae]ARK29047.1 Phage gp6-like head-tail connector protein [Halalkalibacter krulwichiae]